MTGAGKHAVLWSWTSIGDLAETVGRGNPSLLVEQVGDTEFAVGPAFGVTGSVCLDCYLGRRRANGGAECRPVDDPGRVSRSEVAQRLLGDFFSGGSDLASAQVHIGQGGAERHIVLGLPGCTCCRNARMASPTSGEGYDWVDAAVSSRLGLVHRVNCGPAADGFTVATAIGSRTDVFCGRRAFNLGRAADRDPRRARVRAVAESIERYAAAAFDPARCVPFESIDTARRMAPSRAHAPVIDDWAPERWRWVQGIALATADEIFVPACLAFLPYVFTPDEPRLQTQSSSGLAVAASLDAAFKRGLLELVERDALMRAWTSGATFEACADRAVADGTMHVRRVPCPWSVAVVAALLERDEPPYSSVGLAARFDLAEAMEAAIAEAIGVFHHLREQLESLASTASRVPARPGNALRHARDPQLRHSRRRLIEAGAWTGGRTRFPPDRLRREIAGAAGVDLTLSDVRALGLHAVRVIAPSLVSLDATATDETGCPTAPPVG